MDTLKNSAILMAVAFLCLLQLNTAHALEISASAGADSTVASSVVPTASTSTYTVDSGSANGGTVQKIVSSDNAVTGSHAFGEAIVREGGYMVTSAIGSGTEYSAFGEVIWNDVFTNDTSSDIAVVFDFNILAGELRTTDIDATNDFASSSYYGEIYVNNTLAWATYGQIDHSNSGPTLTTSGVDLGGTFQNFGTSSNYQWADSVFALDLGNLAAGESLELTYKLGTKTYGVADEAFFENSDLPYPNCQDTTAACVNQWRLFHGHFNTSLTAFGVVLPSCTDLSDPACEEDWIKYYETIVYEASSTISGSYCDYLSCVADAGYVASNGRFGDPFGFDSTSADVPLASITTKSVSVPEASSLLMLLFGLTGLLFSRRSFKR